MLRLNRFIPVLIGCFVLFSGAMVAMAQDDTYTVTTGDSLDKIGAIYDVQAACLAKTNNIVVGDMLKPGQVLTITVTLNSSVAGALLTGNVGISVNLSGMGMHSTSGQVTVPASGYISWTLNLSGPASHMYISSSITSQ